MLAAIGSTGCGGGHTSIRTVSVTPATASISTGATQQFRATGTFSDGSSKDVTGTATWSSSSSPTATINSAGLATAVSAGSSTITASLSGASGNATLTVTPAGPTLSSIAVTPAMASIAVAATQQFTATGTYSDGSTNDISSTATWSSSSSSTATINSAGLATAVALGTSTITASSSGVSGTAALTVSSGVTVQKVVVDSQYLRPLSGLTLVFTSGSKSVIAATNNTGQFSAAVPTGSQTLTIAQGLVTLITATVTVGADGSLAEYPGTIQVTLPAYPIGDLAETPAALQEPAFGFEPDTPYSGQNVTFSYTDSTSTATEVAVAFNGAGCGGLANGQATGFTYQQTAAVASAGSCKATIKVTSASGTQTLTTGFTVLPTSVTMPAVSVFGGYYVPGDSVPAAASPTADLEIGSIGAPASALANGSFQRFSPQVSGLPTGATLVSFLIAISGQSGYLTVPASEDSNGNYYFDLGLDPDYFTTNSNPSFVDTHKDLAGKLDTHLLTQHGHIGAAATATNSPNAVNISVSAKDSQGNVSPPSSLTIPVQQVSEQTPLFSLVYSGPGQLFLNIDGPCGTQSGLCDDNYLNDYETLRPLGSSACQNFISTYPQYYAPPFLGYQFVYNPLYLPPDQSLNVPFPDGSYSIAIDFLAECNLNEGSGEIANVDYRITATGNGPPVIYSGTLTPAQEELGSSGSFTPVSVGTFNYTAPGGPTVQGRATYEDMKYYLMPSGVGVSKPALPIRDALVEVHRVSDDVLLASSSTDDNGEFNIAFGNPLTPGYYVLLKATNPSGDPLVNQEVDNLQSDICPTTGIYSILYPNTPCYTADQAYSYQSANYDETVTPNNTITLDVPVDGNSGACNIYDKGVSGFRFIAPYLAGVAPPRLTWTWQTNEETLQCPGSSCYSNDTKTISVRSDDIDTAEFMDPVLLHEFGHYFQFNYGSQSTPGGTHDFTTQETPTLAWAEGFATYFGQTVLGSPQYLNVWITPASFGVAQNLSLPLQGAPLGAGTTILGTPQTGNLGEALPAAALWALASQQGVDSTFEISANMSLLTSATGTNRDAGGFDFVDFLDSWICSGYPSGTADSNGVPGTGMHAIVNDSLQFPYDYAAPCTAK